MGAAPSINDISEKEFELFKHLKQEYEQKVKELNASEAQAGAEVTHPGSWLQAGNQQVIDDLTAKLRATEAELQNERAGGSGGGGGGDGGGGVPAPPRSSSPQWNESDTYVLSVTLVYYHHHNTTSYGLGPQRRRLYFAPHAHAPVERGNGIHGPHLPRWQRHPLIPRFLPFALPIPSSRHPWLTPFVAHIASPAPLVRPPPAGNDTH